MFNLISLSNRNKVDHMSATNKQMPFSRLQKICSSCLSQVIKGTATTKTMRWQADKNNIGISKEGHGIKNTNSSSLLKPTVNEVSRFIHSSTWVIYVTNPKQYI